MTAPDYEAEARCWLDAQPVCLKPNEHGSPCACAELPSLTALLERLCGEAGSFAHEQAQRERDGWHQAELDFKAQLSEARAEVGMLQAMVQQVRNENQDAFERGKEEGRKEQGEKYYELLYAVAQKFPNESRHETALRYIREREQSSVDTGQARSSK